MRSGCLWSTSFRCLNDVEEISGFFKRRLPYLIKEGVERGVPRAITLGTSRARIATFGSLEAYKAKVVEGLQDSLQAAALEFDIFITSFCSTEDGADTRDGLLSQWRAYGKDGGVAIVFDTKEIEGLLIKEGETHGQPFVAFGNVDYLDRDFPDVSLRHEETVEWEERVKRIIEDVAADTLNFKEKSGELFLPIFALSTRYKHIGFREEKEVRIVTVVMSDEQREILKGNDPDDSLLTLPPKKVFEYSRSGVQARRIELFDSIQGPGKSLPVREVVVGPCVDRAARVREVKSLLDELDVKADVRAPTIPFVDR